MLLYYIAICHQHVIKTCVYCFFLYRNPKSPKRIYSFINLWLLSWFSLLVAQFDFYWSNKLPVIPNHSLRWGRQVINIFQLVDEKYYKCRWCLREFIVWWNIYIYIWRKHLTDINKLISKNQVTTYRLWRKIYFSLT